MSKKRYPNLNDVTIVNARTGKTIIEPEKENSMVMSPKDRERQHDEIHRSHKIIDAKGWIERAIKAMRDAHACLDDADCKDEVSKAEDVLAVLYDFQEQVGALWEEHEA